MRESRWAGGRKTSCMSNSHATLQRTGLNGNTRENRSKESCYSDVFPPPSFGRNVVGSDSEWMLPICCPCCRLEERSDIAIQCQSCATCLSRSSLLLRWCAKKSHSTSPPDQLAVLFLLDVHIRGFFSSPFSSAAQWNNHLDAKMQTGIELILKVWAGDGPSKSLWRTWWRRGGKSRL